MSVSHQTAQEHHPPKECTSFDSCYQPLQEQAVQPSVRATVRPSDRPSVHPTVRPFDQPSANMVIDPGIYYQVAGNMV